MALTPIQEEIVNTPGNLVVRASAGTGKTMTMVNKIAKEIECNKTHKTIAAITFTIKAANEIKNRLTIDIFNHFIGTNNSFAIEEVIKPFMKDVYGLEFDLDMTTDYSFKVNTFEEGIEKIRKNKILCSYRNNKRNFIFELAKRIVEKSLACKLYLKSRYFKIYIDEYQDCDQMMHDFFMYLCDELKIETFIVGDEKQSIYIWRGAYPEAFKSIWNKSNFKSIFMGDNFRSCQQIQNYSNLLFDETKKLYMPTDDLSSILLISTTIDNWAKDVLANIDPNKKSALLRFTNNCAKTGANDLKNNQISYVYIPQTPISDITTNAAWLYSAIAKYIILEKYSHYDLISEIPVEGNENLKTTSIIKTKLEKIKDTINNEDSFSSNVKILADYLGYDTCPSHIKKLYETVSDNCYHVAFQAEKYDHIAITFHSSKGLEFEQVIIFAEDYYNIPEESNLYNHYVAVTRAKSKLIIVKFNNYKDDKFQSNLEQVFSNNGRSLKEVITFCYKNDTISS